MAPRKNSKNNNTTQENPRRGRPRTVKTNPKSPNNIKIEISVKKSSESPRRVTKKPILSNENKIALANEVVRYQLNKKPRISNNVDGNIPAVKVVNDGKKAKNPVVSKYFQAKKDLEVLIYQLNKKPRNTNNFDENIPAVEVVNNRKKAKPVVSKSLQAKKGLDDKGNGTPKKKVTKKTASGSNVVGKKTMTRKRSADSTQKIENIAKAKKPNVEPKRRRNNTNMVRKVPEEEIIEETTMEAVTRFLVFVLFIRYYINKIPPETLT